MSLSAGILFAQDNKDKPKKKKDRPVYEVWGSGYLIDEQTTMTHDKKSIETQIQHRFGQLNTNGIKDLFGIYAPSANTRMGLSYSVLDNLEVGYGITRINMMSDFHVKYKFLSQTRKDRVPVSVAIYANAAIDGRNESVFSTITEDSVYKFANRMSYFTQLIVTRKFSDIFSLGFNASFTHFNTVAADSIGYSGQNHDVIGLGLFGRLKFSPQSSIVFHYSMPLNLESINEHQVITNQPKANFGIGYQVATASHAFEIFITSSTGLLPQNNYMWNTNDWTKGEILIGFNITRFWGF